VLDWQASWPLSARVSILSRVTAGHVAGREPPLHHRFYLGGVFPYPAFSDRQYPLPGYEVQSISGRNLQAASASVQFRLPLDAYLAGGLHAGRAGEAWDWRVSAGGYLYGYSLTLGKSTRFGPVEVTLAAPRSGGSVDLVFGGGHRF
jgi:outer membrane protein assembly factor BamA